MKPLENEIKTDEFSWPDLSRGLALSKPSAYISDLRKRGKLGELLPEVDRLFGIPQPVQHHPEIDTGIHTLMALDRAAELTDRIDVRFAVLVHDLGKAHTDPTTWPKHYKHEQFGVKPIQDMGTRLHIPNETIDLAVSVCRYHIHAHRSLEMRPGNLVRLCPPERALCK